MVGAPAPILSDAQDNEKSSSQCSMQKNEVGYNLAHQNSSKLTDKNQTHILLSLDCGPDPVS